MSNVFDTLLARGGPVASPGAGAVIATLFVVPGAVYELFAEVVQTPAGNAVANAALYDDTTFIAQMFNLPSSATTAIPYGSLSIPRHTNASGLYKVVAPNADAGGSYFAQIQASPLRGSFQS